MITRGQAVQASLLTTFGALLVFGALPLPGSLLAIGLIVLGVLVLSRTLTAPNWLAVVLFGLASLLIVRGPVQRWMDDFMVPSTHLVAGGFLLALGILQLAGPALEAEMPGPEPATF